jgi:hypothetical protein
MIAIDIVGLSKTMAARLRVAARTRSTLAPVGGAARRARVTFSDDNGPKGGVAIRCTIDTRVTRRAPLHVEGRGTSAALALRDALERLQARVARTVGASRTLARHPKKYFVAARAAAPLVGGAP